MLKSAIKVASSFRGVTSKSSYLIKKQNRCLDAFNLESKLNELSTQQHENSSAYNLMNSFVSSDTEISFLYNNNNILKLPSSSYLILKLPEIKKNVVAESNIIDNIRKLDPRQGILKEILLPSIFRQTKLAARLVVIRRKKMKKHRLKKYLKKHKVFIENRQRKKFSAWEKALKSELTTIYKSAVDFDAMKYVMDTIANAKAFRNYQPEPKKPDFKFPFCDPPVILPKPK